MFEKDTIVAIATPLGQGGIGVVRISGVEAVNIADKVFVAKSQNKLSSSVGYRAHFGQVVENNLPFDEAISVVFHSPASYTGEDVVEISVHGGLYILKKLLRVIIDAGARLALPGEFTKRAFLNGKISLTQAEAVADLINAQSKLSASSAFMIKQGALYNKINQITDELLNTSSHLAAWTDFPEEGVDEITKEQLLTAITNAKKQLESLIKNYDDGKLFKEGINTTIIGKPNVGKSTLMNALVGYDKSIVTDIEGTTRDVIEEKISLGDIVLNIRDTAGVRETSDVVEKIGVDRSLGSIEDAQLVLAVFDSSQKLSDDDHNIIDRVKTKNTLAIINKSDLANLLDTAYIEESFQQAITISAKLDVEPLKAKIKEVMNIADFDASSNFIANERQLHCAIDALEAIEAAIDTLEIGMTFDAVSVKLDESIEHLLELSGKNVSTQTIDKVFENFCVGK